MNTNNETPVLYVNNLKKVGNSIELKPGCNRCSCEADGGWKDDDTPS
jgi:hypothetical protein